MSDTDTSKLNLYQKLLKITEAVGTIEKTGRNTSQGYGFIEQGMIVAELRPQLAKYGVVIMPETVSRTVKRYTTIKPGYNPNEPPKEQASFHANVVSRYTVVNADNPSEKFSCEWDGGEALDTSDKATNKAVTASHKTYLMKLFNISDKEDADSESPVVPPAAQPQAERPVAKTAEPVVRLASDVQKAQVKSFAHALGITDENLAHELHDKYGVANPARMTYAEAISAIEAMK